MKGINFSCLIPNNNTTNNNDSVAVCLQFYTLSASCKLLQTFLLLSKILFYIFFFLPKTALGLLLAAGVGAILSEFVKRIIFQG